MLTPVFVGSLSVAFSARSGTMTTASSIFVTHGDEGDVDEPFTVKLALKPGKGAAARILRQFCKVRIGAWRSTAQQKRATFPTSKAPISAVFHSFRLIFGRAIVSRNGLDAWMLVSGTRARGALTLKRR